VRGFQNVHPFSMREKGLGDEGFKQRQFITRSKEG
jgi:hypothetical protein